MAKRRAPAAAQQRIVAVSQRIVALSQQIAVIAFSALEEQFFREGDELSKPQATECFADLDHGYTRPSIWRQLTRWLRASRPAHSTTAGE